MQVAEASSNLLFIESEFKISSRKYKTHQMQIIDHTNEKDKHNHEESKQEHQIKQPNPNAVKVRLGYLQIQPSRLGTGCLTRLHRALEVNTA